ncbi:unnamed protein product [Amaranthus hypochondriacus]
MVDNTTNENSCKGIDPSSPYYLHPASNTNLVLSPVVLRGNNYGEWAWSIQNAFKANNKIAFLDGSISSPTDASSIAAWVQVNSMLTAWIQNTLDASIRSTVPLTDNVKDMWDDLKQRFSIGNGPRINELRRQISSCEQLGDSVVTYYGRLRKLWEELNGYLTPPCSCKCSYGSKEAITKEKEDERVHTSLIGLDSNQFGNVQSNMLMQDPLPSLNTVFSKAITEERNNAISRSHDKKGEVVGFAMQGNSRGHSAIDSRGLDRPRSTTTCTHCHKVGHEQDTCFELLGYPDWWYAENRAASRGRGRGRGTRGGKSSGGRSGRGPAVAHATHWNAPSSSTNSSIGAGEHTGLSISTEQWQQLMGMFTSLSNNNNNNYVAKLDGKSLSTRWIIDSGCSNHMSGNKHLFTSFTDVPPSSVGLPNGTQSIATKEGTVTLSDTLFLHDVLYVPELTCNLISVSQLLAHPLILLHLLISFVLSRTAIRGS